MSNGASLERLAEIAGVEPDYWDIWGNHHQISAASKRRILGALGLAADDDAAIERSLRRLSESRWRCCLPPVLVVWEDAKPEVALRLPVPRVEQPIVIDVRGDDGLVQAQTLQLRGVKPVERQVIDGTEIGCWTVTLPGPLPTGYYAVQMRGSQHRPMRLIVAPRQCYLPPALAQGDRTWGLSVQLYTVRSAGNWGIGDFTDLQQVIDVAADLGATVVGLNPLHALFLAFPQDASPYSPSSRLFLNPLYIDVEAIPNFSASEEARAAVREVADEVAFCRSRDEVSYRQVAHAKLQVLKAVYAGFERARSINGEDTECVDFERFRSEHGDVLRRYALFEALSEYFEGRSWRDWPEPFRDPASPEVAEFARAHAPRVGFHEFVQWQADRQLRAAQDRARERGLPIGIYRDLAVGASRDGADAWADQKVIVQGAKVGCPPDPFNMLGQDWGIPPLHPIAMREQGYAPFIAMLRANMRHAGGLRIDHVMGLMHLFWIPADGNPAEGAYVKYPFEELLAILALESQRNRCLVVGEDLGTVPPGFRERMAEANVLSYRVLYFEKNGDHFRRPDEYPPLALACVTTHDLATLVGFWQGADLDLKRQLHLYPTDEAQRSDEGARGWDKTLMLRALASEQMLPTGIDAENPNGVPMTPALIAALHAYLARSPARILLVQIDDLLQESEQINLPGTVFERPNWRRRLSGQIQSLAATPVMQALAAALTERSQPSS